MKEIGGYLQLEKNYGRELYPDAMAVDCARTAAVLLAKARGYKSVLLPFFLCQTVRNAFESSGINTRMYDVGDDFLPTGDLDQGENEAVYIVNYYGQLRDKTDSLTAKYKNIMLDNAQDMFFNRNDVDCIYSCRKYFGVPDGAYALPAGETDKTLYESLPTDKSFDRMEHLLGRFENPANEFYESFAENGRKVSNQVMKKMSMLTHNLLRGIDYDRVRKVRGENFAALHSALGSINLIKDIKTIDGAFMYPLRLENGEEIRKKLQKEKIYVPKLWPDSDKSAMAAALADTIVPLPCDQRYDTADMQYVADKISQLLG